MRRDHDKSMIMAICTHCETRGEPLYSPCPNEDGYFLIEDEEYFGNARDPWLGKEIGGRFIIVSILGQGSMGHVYKAYQRQVDRMVAMKLFEPDKVVLSDEDGPATRERFIQEAQVLAKLSHPNCVTLYDFGYEPDRGFLYIAMEHVAGISLRRAVRRGIRFDAIVEVVRQVLMALREAHALDIVHRDLKPENIILSYRQTSEEQIVKVLDFGIAKLLRKEPHQRTQAGLLFGTPAYMSPEQCRGETDVMPASDIYSLGCMTYEMISGHLPFDSDIPQEMVRQHQYEPIPDLLPRRGTELPEEMEKFVRTCMEKEPEERYANAAVALKAFNEVVGQAFGGGALQQGMAGLTDEGLSRRVAVPGNRITGATLDPTGERDRPEVLAEMDMPEQNAASNQSVDREGDGVTDTVRGKEAGTSRPAAKAALGSGLSGRLGLLLAAVVAVLLFATLLISVVYVLFLSP